MCKSLMLFSNKLSNHVQKQCFKVIAKVNVDGLEKWFPIQDHVIDTLGLVYSKYLLKSSYA
jgi:hypothetical protein